MKIKTNELTGPALDWAVAKCVGLEKLHGICAAPETPTPTAMQPLTDEDIDAITHAQWGPRLPGVMVAAHREYARAVEAEVIKRMQK